MFKSKLKLETGNWKIPYGWQAAILKVTWLKIKRLSPIHTSDVQVRFGLDIQSQTKIKVRKPKNQIWLQGSHLKVTSLKINRLLSVPTNNMLMKFEIQIPKQTWFTLRIPCLLRSLTDGRTDGQGESSIPPYQLRWVGMLICISGYPVGFHVSHINLCFYREPGIRYISHDMHIHRFMFIPPTAD